MDHPVQYSMYIPIIKKRVLPKITTCQYPNFLILLQGIYQIIQNVITVKEKTIKFLIHFEGYQVNNLL